LRKEARGGAKENSLTRRGPFVSYKKVKKVYEGALPWPASTS